MPHEWLLPNASLSMLRSLSAMGSTAHAALLTHALQSRADLVIGMLDVTLFLSGAVYRRRRDDGSKLAGQVHRPSANGHLSTKA